MQALPRPASSAGPAAQAPRVDDELSAPTLPVLLFSDVRGLSLVGAARAEAWSEYARLAAERVDLARTTFRGLYGYSDAELLELRDAKDALTALRIEAQLLLAQRWTLSNPLRMLVGPFPSERAALFDTPVEDPMLEFARFITAPDVDRGFFGRAAMLIELVSYEL